MDRGLSSCGMLSSQATHELASVPASVYVGQGLLPRISAVAMSESA